MNKYLILCVDDERDILDSVLNDLAPLEEYFVIEAAESVAEARDVIADAMADHLPLALVLCDHIMPDETGIDFLIALKQHPITTDAKKLLLTGQAGLEETIQAVNTASLDYYIAKPWNGEQLLSVIKAQLTEFVICHEKELMPWARVLDTEKIFAFLSANRIKMSSE